ncbi:MAG TPA: histidine kinase [Longimicrobium sp.]|nr:histidine kinase [Longimicrobium sp.]
MPRLDNAPGGAALEHALDIRLDRRFWMLYGAAWLGVLLFFYTRAFTVSFNRDTPFYWRQDALETLATYGQWALYAPLIVWGARRVSFFRGCRRKALAFHGALSLLIALSAVAVQTFWAGRIWTDEPALFSRHFNAFFHWQVMFYWLILSVTQGLEYQRRWQRDQLQTSRLETELARAELRALRMQMEPHFLYNTLHTVSEMVHVDPPAAERMIVRLGLLLRHTTETGSQEVPLEREIEFLRAYLEIEQARFHDRLTVSIDVPDELLACAVPSLILQPLVENAIRHGTSRLAGAGTVRIGAARRGDALVLRVADNGPGLGAPGGGRGTGVGLRNIRSRLRHLYGDAGRLTLEPAEGGGLEAAVSLPHRPAPAPAPLAAVDAGGVDETGY